MLAIQGETGCGERAHEDATARVQQRLAASFAPGSLVIPMDTTYQDSGTLKAFGLVYELLRAGIPVHFALKPGKAQGDADFTASGKDLQTGATITDHGYRAGPFVIDSADRAAALPIISAWQAANVTAVHDMTASFDTEIHKTLSAAPRIAVFVDGNEDIAFAYLNAAGIEDSLGQAWPDKKLKSYASYPDVLTPDQIKGPTSTGAADGALLRPDGTPNYCQVTSMHYASPADEEVVREVRAWLSGSSLTHAFMECHAAEAFENAANGRFLTTQGLINDGNVPSPITNRHPDSPFTQYDGTFTPVGGSLSSIGLPKGSALRATDTTLINLSTAPTDARIVWLTGFLDGDSTKGKVSYLSGHQYQPDLPISKNPSTNGIRLFLDSLFESECANAASQPNLSLTKTAPASVTESTLTYTLTYASSGPGIADSAVLTDPLPAGATFVSASDGGTFANGVVTWSLGNITSGKSGSVTVTIGGLTNGTSYTNQAELAYKVSVTPKSLKSNGVTTLKTGTPVADLSVTVSDSPDPVASGGAVDYTVNVSNGGPDLAPTVSVTLTLPAGATFVSGSGTDWSCSTAAGAVTCSRASSPLGASPPLTIRVTAPTGPATMTSTVAVSSPAADPGAANNTTNVTTTVSAGPASDAGSDGGPGELLDSDNDGIADVVERRIGTDPFDADSDDDGVPDGQEPDFDKDTDGDGLINALDPDSDDDGLFDGTELGLGCSNPATNIKRGRCIPDADPTTKTNPLDADTDKGGVEDGSEDVNLNGKVDAGETDPTDGHGADDSSVKDTDGDGLSDGLEQVLGSNPNDADSDDDGVADGAEPNPADDTDHDGLKNVLDADSDNDGLFDGTEMGLGCSNPATDATKKRCRADGDSGATKTSPLLWDTDGGGASDGSEDFNLDGVLDATERDPTAGHGGDDEDIVDSDGDGLGDEVEKTIGSDPADADSDDDGLIDGLEPNPGEDTDGDGRINVRDPDSDGDGIFDGTEAGKDCTNAATAPGTCIADADPGTTTAVLDPDTDHGGVKDGDEDANHNGKVDMGERDPNNRADDNAKTCKTNSDCDAGSVCIDGLCAPAPNGGSDAGPTSDAGKGNGDAGNATPAKVDDDGTLEGGGCACSLGALAASDGWPASGTMMLAGAIFFARRLRRRS
jgi:uncharacterized repeat protein (TIGR01451 family)